MQVENIQTILKKLSIGDTLTLLGNFQVKQDAKKVAISYYIPAGLRLINPELTHPDTHFSYYSPENNIIQFRALNPDNDSWYSCWPDHMEVRFDRLFLYYSDLKK